MAKRRLNKQQRNRIAHNQLAKQDADLKRGLVVTHYGSEVEVVALRENDCVDVSIRQRCHLRANLPAVVCGDQVLWRAAETTSPGSTGVVETLLARRSVIERPRPYQDPKPVAANIDTIVLVIAAEPEPISTLIDRYLIAAEVAHINAIILLNKAELLSEQPEEQPDSRSANSTGRSKIKAELDELLALYKQLGYPVYLGSATHNTVSKLGEPGQKSRLQNLFNGQTSILVGQSGVGKSSIINTVVNAQQAAVGDVSNATAKGRHTTTTAALYFLDADQDQRHREDLTATGVRLNNAVIDSPGIREFGLWHLSETDIIYGLREFKAFTERCRFRDCEHGISEGCALQAAFEEGKIHPSRMASYQHILQSRLDP